MLLHVGEEVLGHATAGKHHRLAAEGAALGAADVEGVGKARDVGQRDVAFRGGQAVGEACAV